MSITFAPISPFNTVIMPIAPEPSPAESTLMTLLKELRSYACKIKFEAYDETSLLISQRAVEINTTKIPSGGVSSENNNDLLFVLFFMYLQGYEYVYTLGSSYTMNYVQNDLTAAYTLVCAAVSEAVIECVHDVSQYRVPEHMLNVKQASRLPEHPGESAANARCKMANPKGTDGFLKILDTLHRMFRNDFTKSDLFHLVCLLRKIPGRSYSTTGYDQSLSIHSAAVGHKKMDFPSFCSSAKKLCEDVLVIQEVMFGGEAPSLQCVREMLAPMKAVLFHGTHKWIYCDFSLFQNICSTDTETVSFIFDSLLYHGMLTPEEVLGFKWVLQKLEGRDHNQKERSLLTYTLNLDRPKLSIESLKDDRYRRIEPYYRLLGYSRQEFIEEVKMLL